MFVDQNSLAGEQSLTFHWGHLGTGQLLIEATRKAIQKSTSFNHSTLSKKSVH
jgi:hypothetical protein